MVILLNSIYFDVHNYQDILAKHFFVCFISFIIMCTSVCEYVVVSAGTYGGQKREFSSLDLYNIRWS